MAQFEPANLKRNEEGDPLMFHAKITGAGANDMCNMQELTKESILGLLKDRFKKEVVYTYVGDIVVSVNPFKNVGCVGKSIRNKSRRVARRTRSCSCRTSTTLSTRRTLR